VDLIQAHDIEYRSLDQVIEETLPALREVQKAGKARFIGITGFPLKIFRYVLARAEVDVFLTYCHYTLWDSSAADLVAEMEAQHLGVINAAPLGMGLLSKHGTPPWHPATTEIKDVCAKAVAQCAARGIDVAEHAVQFAVANARFHTTLVGTADPEEVKRNVRAVEQPLDRGLIEEMQRLLAPIRNKTWAVGRPDNN
jgi:L-galactose dehydrogenase